MPRVKGGPRAHKAHKKVVNLAKGYTGTRSRNFRRAQEAVLKAGEHAFAGRRQRRRDLRRLWITRINGALTPFDVKYSVFIKGLKTAKIDLNRKILSEMAVENPEHFAQIVQTVKDLHFVI